MFDIKLQMKEEKQMILKTLKLHIGHLNLVTNCYIVVDEKSKEAMVIDPGAESEKIIEMLDILDANLKYIFLTHCHADHIGAVDALQEAKGGKILISREDSTGLHDTSISLTYYTETHNPEMDPDSRVDDGDLIHVGDLEFRVIATPGHTKGGLCLYCPEEDMIFTGDTIFSGTWGRTDLPTGSIEDIMDSITQKILILPENTIVYPGHGKSTLIKEEKPIYLELRRKDY